MTDKRPIGAAAVGPATAMPPTKVLPYGRQLIDEQDIAAVVSILNGDWITQGPAVAAFEAAFAAKVGAAHAVAVSSGTAALHLAYLAAGLGPGDEIVTTPITFAATANAARMCGAEIKFADIDPDTLCLDPSGLSGAISPATKVIAPVDFCGLPCAMDEINAIAERHGIAVVTDAAHSLGASYRRRIVGALADMTCFSFHPVKSITTGEGGMITTDSAKAAERMRLLRSHGIRSGRDGFTIAAAANDTESGARNPAGATAAGWYGEMLELGLNYRLTDIQSALGESQLRKLDAFVARRREIAARYTAAFHGHDAITLQRIPTESESAWHLFVIMLNLERLTATRREIYDRLKSQGLGLQIHYIPVHLHPYYRRRYAHNRGDFPHAEAYYDRCLSLPIFPAMTDDDIARVITTVLSEIDAARRN